MIKLTTPWGTSCWILADSIEAVALAESDKGMVTAIYTTNHVFTVSDSPQRVVDLIMLEKQGVGRS